jgi:hypothetical protein
MIPGANFALPGRLIERLLAGKARLRALRAGMFALYDSERLVLPHPTGSLPLL